MGWWMLGAFAICVAEGPLLLLVTTEINHDGHVIDLILLLVLLMALELLSRCALGGLREDHLTLHQVILILIQGKLLLLLLLWLSCGVI